MIETSTSTTDRVTLNLLEIGRLQNNAGSILQMVALIFVICVYYFNALIYPNNPHRVLFAIALIVTASLVTISCIQFFRCLMISTARTSDGRFHLFTNVSEGEIEAVLNKMVFNFRIGAACFFIGLLCTFVLLCLLALGSLGMIT